jgi:hypothetical protein
MAKCPFAVWHPISGSCGRYVGEGPFRIVHHTTEGSSAEGAIEEFRAKRSDPHFTVDSEQIHQHIDTGEAARALRNPPGGVETNRHRAVQIELVGFAHLAKDPAALANVARLCRWIEATHDVPRTWPAGPPRPAKNGRDPGGHNRDPRIWAHEGGHYGHCHVPENDHWDPGYSAQEAAFVLDASFDAFGEPTSPKSARPARAGAAGARRARGSRASARATMRSTMPDHGIVSGVGTYVRGLSIQAAVPMPPLVERKPRDRKVAARARKAAPPPVYAANVDVGSLLSFVDGLNEQEKQDVLYSVQLAQRGASGSHDRFAETRAWYLKYVEILENLGWAIDQLAFTRFEQQEGEFRMDQAALAIIAAIATQNQLAVLQQSLSALSKLAEDDGTIRLFDFHASAEGSGNFQIGAVQRSENGALSVALGAFYFRSADDRKRFLFFKWGSREINFWTAAQRMTLNADFYARRRADVVARLEDAADFISDLKLGAR